MLCCPKLRNANLETSQLMLNLFVENFPIIFGENSVSYNVHSLLHLKKTVAQVGDPIAGSAYAFENYLQTLKRHIRKPTKILEQIYRKIMEDEKINQNCWEKNIYFKATC